MNLSRRENAGVFTLMGLTLHHHSNAIHELFRSQPWALSFQHISRSKTAVLHQMTSSLSYTFTFLHPNTGQATRILQGRRKNSGFSHHPYRIYCIRQQLQRKFTRHAVCCSLVIESDDWLKLIYICFLGKHTNTLILPSSTLPSQLDHDNPLHPGNMSSLIRLVSASLEKPRAPCGEGPTREASAATRQRRPGKEGQDAAWT